MKFVIVHFSLIQNKLQLEPFLIADTDSRYQFSSREEAASVMRECNFTPVNTAIVLEGDYKRSMEVHELITAVESGLMRSAIDLITNRRSS